ncbi:MAG: flagellar hook-basal body complex protein [Proteobacteria bacterium]|nr:flagellar hook-basal body complex protein [Pseudomonadota bacterium]MBU1714231.1 flagellar hook-basal body complex protein [Pseudomonadota bacterium]
MGISSSLYSSISGLNTMGNSMSVIGDNVANVNTIAFKSSRATFQDVLSQSVSTAAGSAQVGRGVTLSTVGGLFAQGSFESSSTPTDMAIGGQGFFMLRQPENAEADNYSRAGEFRFDQEGNLVNPVGYFVQGWEIDSDSGERIGTIGDIGIGKSTPPVATDQIDIIVNVDSREANEVTEVRLYDAWDGRNAALVNPTEPIASTNYEYTSSIKVYDSIGASHDITVYFDRTTRDNQWEFLITCDPSEDQRYLTANDQSIYTPDQRYNYENHKGAGALMYGIMDFSTSGDITHVDAFNVPPDAEVDPAQSVNRLTLASSDSYYSFDSNFTGDIINHPIALNFGAVYSGQSTSQSQVIVSDMGAYDSAAASSYITADTVWNDVFDANGNRIEVGDQFTFGGYDHDGDLVAPWTYTVPATTTTTKVQDLLNQFPGPLAVNFGCTATIDAFGRLRLIDNQGGDSAMAMTTFTFLESGVLPATVTGMTNPFGAQVNVTTSKQQQLSTGRALSTASTLPPAISPTSDWSTSVFDQAGTGVTVGATATITFTGTTSSGAGVVATTFTADPTIDSPNGNVQDLLDWMENLFDAEASIDNAGRLVMTDRVADTAGGVPSSLIVNITAYGAGMPPIFGPAAPFDSIAADVSGEDGSRQGDDVSNAFDPQALASTQYANASTTIFQDQDGYSSGFLQSVSVDTEGVITGHYSNGQVLQKAQVALATFNNLSGLFKEGGNIYSETTDSGAPVTGAPGTNGLGSIAPNALEQSNVDIGTEFVKLITTQRGFQANSKIISTTDEMLADLINIKR